MRKFLLTIAVVSSFVAYAPVKAADESSRTHHRFGAYFGLIDPLPSLYAINIAINLTSFFRVTAGYGGLSVSSTTGSTSLSFSTLAVGGRFFVPNWSLSPTLGASYGHVSASATDGTTHQGFSGSGDHVYASFGLDWQAHCGFNLGAGWNQSLKSGVGGLPYLDIGWFF